MTTSMCPSRTSSFSGRKGSPSRTTGDFVRKFGSLLFANGELTIAYLLPEQFKYAYDAGPMDVMVKGLEQWSRPAQRSDVPEILRFAQTLRAHQDGPVNRVIHKTQVARSRESTL